MQLSKWNVVGLLLVLCFLTSATGLRAGEEKEEKKEEEKIGSKVKVVGTIVLEKKEIEKKKEKYWPIVGATLSADGGGTYHILLDSKGKSLAKKMTRKKMENKKMEVKGVLTAKPRDPKDKKQKAKESDNGEKWVKVSSYKEVKEEKEEKEEEEK